MVYSRSGAPPTSTGLPHGAPPTNTQYNLQELTTSSGLHHCFGAGTLFVAQGGRVHSTIQSRTTTDYVDTHTHLSLLSMEAKESLLFIEVLLLGPLDGFSVLVW